MSLTAINNGLVYIGSYLEFPAFPLLSLQKESLLLPILHTLTITQ